MMANFFDIGTSVPTPTSNSINRPITTEGIILAIFGISIPAVPNRVLINASVGVTANALNPSIILTVLRGNQVIFSSREQLQLSVLEQQTINLHAIDTNVPPSSNQGYTLRVTLENALLNAASVTGPVTFSGVSYTFG
jgi:hypothetical protein